jgi:AsmA protein
MKIRRVIGIAALMLFGLVLIGVGVLYAIFDGERIKKEISLIVKEQKQRTLDIPGELGLSIWPNIAITAGKASLSERNSALPFVSFDSARVSVALWPLLSRQLSVSAVEFAGLKTTVVKHKDGSFNFSDLLSAIEPAARPDAEKAGGPADTPDAPGKPVYIDVAAIKLTGAQLVWIDEKAATQSTLSNLDISTANIEIDTANSYYLANKVAIAATGMKGDDSFELRLDAPRVLVAADKASGESIALTAKLSSAKHKVAAKLTLNRIQGSVQALSASTVALELDANSDGVTVQGSMESPLAVDIQARTVALEKLTGKLDVAHPLMPMKRMALPLSGHVRADLAKSTADIGLTTEFDESKVAIQLGIAKFAPLAAGFDLDISQLNLDKYFPPPASATAGATAKGGSDKPSADPKVDLSMLNGLNLSGMAKIGALQVSNVKLTNLQAKFSVLDGLLSITPFSANLYHGTVAGSLIANAKGNSVVLKQTLSDVNVGPLLKDVADKDMLEGRGNVVLDVQTDGATVGAMKKSLDGTASFSLKEGAIKGINLAKSFRELKAKLGGRAQDTAQKANSGEKTDFSELTGSFKIAAGVARNDDLAMKSPFLRLGGAGDIDIGNSQLNYLAKASVVNTEAGQEGKELDQLKGLTIPVRLSGPFSSPNYKIELGSLLSDAAKAKVQAQVEEKKQEVKQKVEDAVKDKLKGLLGR